MGIEWSSNVFWREEAINILYFRNYKANGSNAWWSPHKGETLACIIIATPGQTGVSDEADMLVIWLFRALSLKTFCASQSFVCGDQVREAAQGKAWAVQINKSGAKLRPHLIRQAWNASRAWGKRLSLANNDRPFCISLLLRQQPNRCTATPEWCRDGDKPISHSTQNMRCLWNKVQWKLPS
jgi:hypothetical protein